MARRRIAWVRDPLPLKATPSRTLLTSAFTVDSPPDADHDETMQDALDDTVFTEPSPAKDDNVNNDSDSGEL
jgi:hypothetical protein